MIIILFVTHFPQNKRDEHLLKRRNVPFEYICEDYDGDGDFRSVGFYLSFQSALKSQLERTRCGSADFGHLWSCLVAPVKV